ncbi:putative mitochondrial-processing peptidase subunit alpha-1 [Capsicum baccatum]|uniref:Mitochondrial-processing peptidase subunit alpha-1 n=1 Tax=Capsicum baccatum TaxID=33114 RepID=A0A2G2X3V8_CAPBA|nr:putative mitochondrial-processing peptidase subunit alpha-1 [Capsicum baccatum]
MYRYASSRLTSLKARQANGFLTRFSSSAAVAATKPSGGLFSWITGNTSSAVTPLDFPLNDVKLSPPLPDYVEPAKTQITTLANGLKVASEASVNPAASIGLYVDCGSIYETPASYGATHLLERMAFKSTLNRSHLRVVREIEAIGGNVTASASREHMIYTYDALKTYVPQMVEMLVDSVRNPAFLDWEVKEQLEKVKAEISEYSKNPQHLLLEAVHSAGYAGPYGNSLMATEATINRLNSKGLEDFVAENYTAPRMVLAASGVEHEELLKVAEPLLSDLPKAATTGEPKPVYVGGDYRRHAESEMTHFALAFEVPGGWMSEKDSMTLTVLQMLMGGGGSFSAGGPGKGMYSRLYLRVLNKYPQMHAFSAFSSIYNNTGLFGIQATTTPDFGPQAVDVAVQELIAVANPAEVDQVQLNRAKQATKSAILMNLESRMVASEDIGRQLLTYGERKPVEHFLKAIDAVSAKDIASVVQKLISSPLTMASYGDVLSLPSYDAVSSRFHSK